MTDRNPEKSILRSLLSRVQQLIQRPRPEHPLATRNESSQDVVQDKTEQHAAQENQELKELNDVEVVELAQDFAEDFGKLCLMLNQLWGRRDFFRFVEMAKNRYEGKGEEFLNTIVAQCTSEGLTLPDDQKQAVATVENKVKNTFPQLLHSMQRFSPETQESLCVFITQGIFQESKNTPQTYRPERGLLKERLRVKRFNEFASKMSSAPDIHLEAKTVETDKIDEDELVSLGLEPMTFSAISEHKDGYSRDEIEKMMTLQKFLTLFLSDETREVMSHQRDAESLRTKAQDIYDNFRYISKEDLKKALQEMADHILNIAQQNEVVLYVGDTLDDIRSNSFLTVELLDTVKSFQDKSMQNVFVVVEESPRVGSGEVLRSHLKNVLSQRPEQKFKIIVVNDFILTGGMGTTDFAVKCETICMETGYSLQETHDMIEQLILLCYSRYVPRFDTVSVFRPSEFNEPFTGSHADADYSFSRNVQSMFEVFERSRGDLSEFFSPGEIQSLKQLVKPLKVYREHSPSTRAQYVQKLQQFAGKYLR